jgi:hypothetical protein
LALRRLLPALLVAIVFAAFAETVRHGFLFLDDRAFIADNPLVANFSGANLAVLWKRALLDLYAPLTYTLWALIGALAGPVPWAFHLTNVVLQALDALLVFALLRRLVGERDGHAAFAGTLLFVLHPLQCETVAWASETKDLLSAFFALLAMQWYLTYEGERSLGAYALATVAFVCGLLAKPSAVVVPGLLVVVERGLLGRSWRRSILPLAPWFALAAVCTFVTTRTQPAVAPGLVAPLWLRPVVALDALTFYLGRLVLPLHLVPDYGRNPGSTLVTGALYYTWIPSTALLVIAWMFRRTLPALAVATGLFVVGLLPVLGLVPFDFQYYSTVADHYVYLAMLGPALGLAFAYGRLPSLLRRTVVPLGLATLGVLTVVQASYWKDEAVLYARTLAVNPRSFMAHNNLGQVLEERGALDTALAHYRVALALDPGDQDALNNIGNVLYKQGHLDDAIQHYTRILGAPVPPTTTVARMHNNLGAAYLRKTQLDDAGAEFRRAIEIDPTYAEAYYNLALILIATGHIDDAMTALQKGLAANPGHPALLHQLEVLRTFIETPH